MKKYMTFLIFTIIMGLGIQSSFGQQLSQNEDRPEAIAKQQVKEMSKTLNLTDDQQRTLFRAMVTKEVAYKKSISGKDLSDPAVMQAKKEADAAFEKALKKTLTEEQMAAYKKGKSN